MPDEVLDQIVETEEAEPYGAPPEHERHHQAPAANELPDVEVVIDEDEPAEPAKLPEPRGKHKQVDKKLENGEYVTPTEFQRRTNELKWQAEEARRDAAAARREVEIQRIATRAIEAKFQEAREHAKVTRGHAVTIAEQKTRESIELASRELQAAEEAGDIPAKIAAQRKLNAAQIEQSQVESFKGDPNSGIPDLDADTRAALEYAKAPPQQARPVDIWKEKNPWFNPAEANQPGTGSYVAIHFAKQMEAEGYNAEHPAFWSTLNQRLEAAVQKMNEEQQAQQQAPAQAQQQPARAAAPSPVAPPSRASGPVASATSVRLTKDEADLAARTMHFLPREEAIRRYAREKQAMSKQSA